MGGTRPGNVDPRSLAATRVDLHHAALLVSGVGRSLAPRQPRFLHASLHWDATLGALGGWPVETPSGGTIRTALTFEPAGVVLLDDSRGLPLVSIDLTGSCFADVRDRMSAALTDRGLNGAALSVRIPADLPPGPIQSGEPFAPDAAAAIELGRWFAFADARLAEAAAAHHAGIPVPCWPDHFDMAIAVRMDVTSEPGPSSDATVTLGFSPGDSSIPEPYFYVTPWPVPPAGVAPLPVAPPGGRWQLDGWMGLALAATSILVADDPPTLAATFLERGYEICRDLLGTDGRTSVVP